MENLYEAGGWSELNIHSMPGGTCCFRFKKKSFTSCSLLPVMVTVLQYFFLQNNFSPNSSFFSGSGLVIWVTGGQHLTGPLPLLVDESAIL